MPPKRDLSKFIAHAHTAVGMPLPPTRAQRLEESGGIAAHAEIAQLALMVPGVSPPYRRQVFSFLQRFVEFLEEFLPEELPKSATPENYPLLMGIFLSVRIQWSKDTTRPTILEDGSTRKGFMSEVTLHTYRQYAQAGARLLLHPAAAADIERACREIGQSVHMLIIGHKLARTPRPKFLMGVDEVDVILKYLFEGDYVTASDLQMGCILLMIMYTASRIGTLVSTPSYEENVLRWEDVTFEHLLTTSGSCIGISMNLTLKHWKGNQWHRKKILKYSIEGVTLGRNIQFDLPLLLFTHAWRCGVLDSTEGKTIADAFSSTGSSLLTVKSECRSRPVFVKHKVGNRADLDPSGPLRAGTVFRRFRGLMSYTGLIGPDGYVPTLYCLRRGTLNRWYYDPQVGAELARLLAGHAPDTSTLEVFYIVRQVDGKSVSLLDHLREIASQPILSDADQRLQTTFPLKSTSDLADTDPLYAVYRKAITALAISISMANDSWKHAEPFLSQPEEYATATADDAAQLLSIYKLLAKRQLTSLRNKERSGTSSIPQASIQSKSVPQEAITESFKLLAALQVELENAQDRAETDPEEEINLKTNEVSLGCPSELDETEELVSPSLLWQKIEHVMHKTTRTDGRKPCTRCMSDASARPDYQSKLWHPYALEDHMSKHHTVEQELKRGLLAKGMDIKSSARVTCKLPPVDGSSCREFCDEEWAELSCWQHLLSHTAHLPPAHLDWIAEYVHTRLAARKASQSRVVERPWLSNIATPAPLHLRFPYDLPPKAETSRLPEYPLAIHQLMDPAYPMPDLRIDGKLKLPTPQNATDDTMRQLASTLAELYPRVPGALYKTDDLTLAIDYRPYEAYMQASTGHSDVYAIAAETVFAEGDAAATDML